MNYRSKTTAFLLKISIQQIFFPNNFKRRNPILPRFFNLSRRFLRRSHHDFHEPNSLQINSLHPKKCGTREGFQPDAYYFARRSFQLV
jgi:hypothetical protein